MIPLSWIEINATAFNHNLWAYKKIIGNKHLGIVVKSNAYGHGLEQIIPLCQSHPAVEWLFVSALSEALIVRSLGYTKSILVLYFIDANPILAAQQNIHLMVDQKETWTQLNEIGKAHNTQFLVHLKIDTGMSRFGIAAPDTSAAIKRIQQVTHVQLMGIYSHLAQAADSDQSMNQKQSKAFYQVLKELNALGIAIPSRHLTNSAGALLVDDKLCNVVRIGLGAYGWWPSSYLENESKKNFSELELQPVLSLKTRIYQIRKISKGSSVGYNQTFIASRDTIVAFLPIGYAQGYPRRLSNKGVVCINGQCAPIIGMIAMTVITVDITDIPHVKVGDEVTLIGSQSKITAPALAHDMASFNARELLVGLSSSLPRIIVP